MVTSLASSKTLKAEPKTETSDLQKRLKSINDDQVGKPLPSIGARDSQRRRLIQIFQFLDMTLVSLKSSLKNSWATLEDKFLQVTRQRIDISDLALVLTISPHAYELVWVPVASLDSSSTPEQQLTIQLPLSAATTALSRASQNVSIVKQRFDKFL